jgi:hypothetical protein
MPPMRGVNTLPSNPMRIRCLTSSASVYTEI